MKERNLIANFVRKHFVNGGSIIILRYEMVLIELPKHLEIIPKKEKKNTMQSEGINLAIKSLQIMTLLHL